MSRYPLPTSGHDNLPQWNTVEPLGGTDFQQLRERGRNVHGPYRKVADGARMPSPTNAIGTVKSSAVVLPCSATPARSVDHTNPGWSIAAISQP